MTEDATASPFVEFRKDGWPLCPCCGEDEMQNPWLGQDHVAVGKPPPTVAEFITAGLMCVNCGWCSNPNAPQFPTRKEYAEIERYLRHKWKLEGSP